MIWLVVKPILTPQNIVSLFKIWYSYCSVCLFADSLSLVLCFWHGWTLLFVFYFRDVFVESNETFIMYCASFLTVAYITAITLHSSFADSKCEGIGRQWPRVMCAIKWTKLLKSDDLFNCLFLQFQCRILCFVECGIDFIAKNYSQIKPFFLSPSSLIHFTLFLPPSDCIIWHCIALVQNCQNN